VGSDELLKVLVVDDEAIFRNLLGKTLSKEGYDVDTASDGLEAIELIGRIDYAVILTDLMMPGAGGMEVLRAAKVKDPDAAVILITGYASLDSALAAIREGAYDFITKPFQLEEIRLTVQNASEKRRLVLENMVLMENLKMAYRQIQELLSDQSKFRRKLENIDQELDRRQREIFEGVQALGRTSSAVNKGAGTSASGGTREARELLRRNRDIFSDDLEEMKKQILDSR